MMHMNIYSYSQENSPENEQISLEHQWFFKMYLLLENKNPF